ncbi:MAG: hypothetical protein DRO73_03475 [Candidatus Thorarchaeota archaeon]|nr:MAG: hypothetical protein DRO73_03475 [Candidatus Thorarchaeota archaeon]
MSIPWTISQMSQLAVLLEVSSPKPGNVNREAGFSDSSFRHFLASAAAMGRGIHLAASRGTLAAAGELGLSEIGIGEAILTTVLDVFTRLNRSNTILGTILLHAPLATAMGACAYESGGIRPRELRAWIQRTVNATTVEDTLNVYRALRTVMPRGDRHKATSAWTEFHARYDIENPHVLENVKNDRMTLHALFKASARVDRVSREWADGFETVIETLWPALRESLHGLEDAEEAIVDLFICQLAEEPDGHIANRAGIEAAEYVMQAARDVIASTENREVRIRDLDTVLRSRGNELNPGSTEDLVSAAVFCRLVEIEMPA